MTKRWTEAWRSGWRRVCLAVILSAASGVSAGAEGSVPSVLRLSADEITSQSRAPGTGVGAVVGPAPTTVLIAASLLLIGGAPAGRPTAQERAPLFRATVDAVVIDAFVHRDGQPITGLAPADFIVRDNGREQRDDAARPAVALHLRRSVTRAGAGGRA